VTRSAASQQELPKQTALKLVQRVSSRAAVFSPVVLKPGVTFVGRTDENGIVLKSTLVSRRHAKLIFTDLGLTVHDLDSHNGVFLNGKKVRSTPVKVGDVLYFADICVSVEQEQSELTPFEIDSSFEKSNLLNEAQATGDDPAGRNLAALMRVTDLLLSEGDEQFFVDAIKACQTLTEAALAVFVKKKADGVLYTPVVVKDGVRVSEDVPVAWPVIRRCVDESATLFSRDTSAEPLVPGDLLSVGDMGALICVPILVDRKVKGAIYLARPFASEGFTDREVETLSAIAHLFALRLSRRHGTDATVVHGVGDTDEGMGQRTAEEKSALEHELRELKAKLVEREAQVVRARDLEAKQRTDEERIEMLERQVAANAAALDVGSQDRAENEGALAVLRAEIDDQVAALTKLRDELAARDLELSDARERLRKLETELQTAQAVTAPLEERLGAAQNESEQLRVALTAVEQAKRDAENLADQAQQSARTVEESARQKALAVIAHLPPGLQARVDARLGGAARAPVVEEMTALVVALAGVDAWVATATSEQARERIDRFASAVNTAGRAHNGVLEQVLGHAHLLSFPASAEGAARAITCALAILAAFPGDEIGGVHCGIHTAGAMQDFFGDDADPSYAQVGEAIAIARGTCEYARQGSVWVTERVRGLVGDAPGLLLIATGPHLIREFRTNPINLFQIAVRG
jgi:hypothetical protein